MDEEYIQELYNNNGGFKRLGSYDAFKKQISINPNYQKSFHSQVPNLGTYDEFVSRKIGRAHV